jgi:DNA-binding NarL/FixJ family response regulator
VLVLDLNGMGAAPLVMVRELRKAYPKLRVVVFSAATDMIPEILATGVQGYVVKDELAANVIDAIWTVWRGQRYLSPIANDYMSRAACVEAPRFKLAPNERQVLHLLAQGLGTTQIASEMDIDPRTVQNYIVTLRRKTGCTERTQLATWYRQISDQEPPPQAT